MAISEVSKRYAKALLAATKQSGLHIQAHKELRVVVEVVRSDRAIQTYFENPVASPDQKAAVLGAALAGQPLSRELVSALVLLAKKNRLGVLDQVLEAYQGLLDAEEGITRGVVRSAQPLSSEGQKEIESKISQALKKKIVLTYELDPKILGGVVAQVGGWKFDDSIDTHLKKLNEELNRRAN